MSYCRWSSDNWKSDVYVYESSQGFETHVASFKRVGVDEIPQVDWELLGAENTKEFMRQYNAQMAALEAAPLEEIGLPHDGESFNDADAEGCARTLRMLRRAGYHIPEGVIEALEEEAKENE